jgi:hypothetical protein
VLEALPVISSANTSRVGAFAALVGAVCAGLGVQALSRRPLGLRRVAIGVGVAGAAVLVVFLLSNRNLAVPAPGSVRAAAVERFLVMLALGAACVVALGRVQMRLAVVFVLVAIVVDLAYLQGYNVILPAAEAHPPRPPSVAALDRQPRPFRISVLRPGAAGLNALLPNSPALYLLESTEGYDFPTPRRWSDFSWYVLSQRALTRERTFSPARPTPGNLRGERMVNTRYYLAPPGVSRPYPEFRTLYRGRDAVVYEDPGALPRAYVVGSVRHTDYRFGITLLQGGQVAPKREAVVPPDAPAVPPAAGGYRPARAHRLGPGHVRVDVPPGRAGWLVLSESYNPLWKAKVDGHEHRLYPTNVASLGLPLSAGSHTVDVRISSSNFLVGVVISLLSLAVLLALSLAGRLSRLRGTPPQ